MVALASFLSLFLLIGVECHLGSEHPDSDFNVTVSQHNREPCSRSTNRRKTACQGFQDRKR